MINMYLFAIWFIADTERGMEESTKQFIHQFFLYTNDLIRWYPWISIKLVIIALGIHSNGHVSFSR